MLFGMPGFLFLLLILCGCATLDRGPTPAPDAPVTVEASGSPFTFISRPDSGFAESAPARENGPGVETRFEIESLIESKDLVVASGCLREIGGPMTMRSLILSSFDRGRTWHEADVRVFGACVSDLRLSLTGEVSGLVFWNNGDGALLGYAHSANRGAWSYQVVQAGFDAQKDLGPGAYSHLGHALTKSAISIYLSGAERSAVFSATLPFERLLFQGFITKISVERRRAVLEKTRPRNEQIAKYSTLRSVFVLNPKTGGLSVK